MKKNFSVLYIEKLESYKQMMATVMSGGWMNFSVLGMRVKIESVEKFSKMLNFQICLNFFGTSHDHAVKYFLVLYELTQTLEKELGSLNSYFCT